MELRGRVDRTRLVREQKLSKIHSFIYLDLLSAYNGLGTHYNWVTCSTREPSLCNSWISFCSGGRQTTEQDTERQNVNMLGKSLGYQL